jgi:oxygen-independent coproporphyrinogen III oxidase
MHLYLHVPFCARRCSYCDFAIAVRRVVPSEAYRQAVLQEWAWWQHEPVWEHSAVLDTVYFGGGTPSRLDPDSIADLMAGLSRDRQLAASAEITLEANPDDVTPAAAKAWRAAGVNRVSLGVQSFNPTVLQWMHRTHRACQVPHAVEAIRRAGIQSLSLDLIFGLPAELDRDWDDDLEQAFGFAPEHLSLYGLTLEPHTVLAHRVGRGELVPVDEERYASEFLRTHQALTERGYEHYEVSNAALPGHRARHNSAYWRRAPFIGLGPSAHSGFANERRWNLRDWAAYERTVTAGASPGAGRELLDSDALKLEELYLGLRTTDGVRFDCLPSDTVESWRFEGWATCSDGMVQLTPEGWLRLDALVASVRS